MKVDLLLGLQWGDEGKGKIVDVLTKNYDIIARFQGGPNAGHTLEFDGIKHVLHTIPSGIFHKESMNLIGNGVVIDPVIFEKEIEKLKPFNINFSKSLCISRKAHLILPTHRLLDAASELSKGKSKIGSTLKGIGPTYMDKTGRNGIRIGDIELPEFLVKYRKLANKHEAMIKSYNVDLQYNLKELEEDFFSAIENIKSIPFIDSENYIFNELDNNKNILAEGAQGSLLDIDFGTYPYVTSSNTTSAGACTGLGVPPNKINDVFGIFKAYTTRVGSGPFPTELFDDNAKSLRRAFLQGPLKFNRVSSRYNLKRRIAYYGNRIRPHKGTDFAASVGTPILATANGSVVKSGYTKGNGNYVTLKHNSTYSTQYLHMKKNFYVFDRHFRLDNHI